MFSRSYQADHIRKVVLALDIRRSDPVEMLPEKRELDAVYSRVDLANLLLLGRRIFRLNDALNRAVRSTNHSAIMPGVIKDRSQHGGGGIRRRVFGDKLLQNIRANKRGIAGQHEDIRVMIAEQRHSPLARIAGAKLLVLNGIPNVTTEALHDLVGTMSDDDYAVLNSAALAGIYDVSRHRLAADRVQGFRQLRLHPCALPCGEYDSNHERSAPVFRLLTTFSGTEANSFRAASRHPPH